MTSVKIISNPYKKTVQFQELTESGSEWANIDYASHPNSALVRKENMEGFFPFQAKKIVEAIACEYGLPGEPLSIVFEGSADEYEELKAVCSDCSFDVPIHTEKGSRNLANARDILPEVKLLFQKMSPLISQSVSQERIQHDLSRFTDASSDVVPICVLGNYSTGKSTFINALIGSEILPSGAEPVTAKVYKISRAKYKDRAKIRCKYLDWGITVTFTEQETQIDNGMADNPLSCELKTALYAMEGEDIVLRVNKALTIINDIENRTEETEISDLIEVEIPFANGVLAKSMHPFVIFDTPGSNSVSNVKHLHVLKEAMANMTNGLPIFLSTPDALDSTDNESLYRIIRELDELDNRFTMIVVNKADSAGIQRRGANEKEQKRVLSQAVPRNLYSGGLFYVSSILGLGSKTDGSFFDYVYEDVYDAQVERYSNPNHKHYRSLYLFNIMPEQIKHRSDALAAAQTDLVYANSGLFSIETEIETFAGKYAAYNKCFQSQLFLRKVIMITEEEIERNKQENEGYRQGIRDKLEVDKKRLITLLETSSSQELSRFENDYRAHMGEYIAQTKDPLTADQVKEKESEFNASQKDKQDYEGKEQDVKEAMGAVADNLKTAFRNRRISLDVVKTAAQGLASDVGTVFDKAKSQRETRREVDKAVADDLMEYISSMFEQRLSGYYTLLNEASKAYWTTSTEMIRKLLAKTVTGSDVLTDHRRGELERIIITYKQIAFTDIINDELFRKDAFEIALRLGNLVIWQSDHLDISKLVKAYNVNMQSCVTEGFKSIEASHKESARIWIQNLLNEIIMNIVEYSPELSKAAQQIKSLTEKIEDLVNRRVKLNTYTDELSAMMDWKET